MKLQPLSDRILVRRIESEEKTAGGLIIPATARERPQVGEVVAIGEGKRLEGGTQQPLDVKAGDRVLFGKYSGSEINIEGEEFLIMREDEILAVLSSGTRDSGGGIDE
jgi:chaperonin GroES